jgi:hypothetical protein
MNSFNFNRFGQTLRWVLATNFRKLLAWTIGAALMVFMGEMFINGINGMDAHPNPVQMLWDFADVGSGLMVLVTVIMVCSVVSSINDKRKRETFLMLPSSNLEKFLALVFYTTVICVLCMFLAYVVGDTLRMAWLWGEYLTWGQETVSQVYNYNGVDETCYSWSSSVPWMLSKLIPRLITVWGNGIYWTWENEWSTLIFHVVLAVWIHSVYTLGGTLFRKYAFVATSVVLLGGAALFNYVLSYFGLAVYNWVDHVLRGITSVGVVLCILLPFLSIINYRASFYIFKGFQLITNKWTNYDILKR